jgi:hypothetical protein
LVDLDWRDFEILEDNEPYEVEYFLRPKSQGNDDENRYMLAFTPRDWRPTAGRWRTLRVRIKNARYKNLVLKLDHGQYFY